MHRKDLRKGHGSANKTTPKDGARASKEGGEWNGSQKSVRVVRRNSFAYDFRQVNAKWEIHAAFFTLVRARKTAKHAGGPHSAKDHRDTPH